MNRFRISTRRYPRSVIFLSLCRALRQTENAITLARQRAGGCQLRSRLSPAVEYFDVFARANPELDQDQMQKIIDQVRPDLRESASDNTTPIARIAATRLDDAALPVGCITAEECSVWCPAATATEFLQVGAEFIGADGLGRQRTFSRLRLPHSARLARTTSRRA